MKSKIGELNSRFHILSVQFVENLSVITYYYEFDEKIHITVATDITQPVNYYKIMQLFNGTVLFDKQFESIQYNDGVYPLWQERLTHENIGSINYKIKYIFKNGI